jgi:hypothetical protein
VFPCLPGQQSLTFTRTHSPHHCTVLNPTVCALANPLTHSSPLHQHPPEASAPSPTASPCHPGTKSQHSAGAGLTQHQKMGQVALASARHNTAGQRRNAHTTQAQAVGQVDVGVLTGMSVHPHLQHYSAFQRLLLLVVHSPMGITCCSARRTSGDNCVLHPKGLQSTSGYQ